jgi:hypothetical protein
MVLERLDRGSLACGFRGHRECSGTGVAPWRLEDSRTHRNPQRGESTGIGIKGSEPIGDSLGELVKGLAFPASMAADLAVIEDQ